MELEQLPAAVNVLLLIGLLVSIVLLYFSVKFDRKERELKKQRKKKEWKYKI